MKTKLILIATLFITTITFSQTARKGYSYYKNSSNTKMSKGELVPVIAKDANKSRKGAARKNRRPQLFSIQKSSKFNGKQEFGTAKAQQSRQRPFDEKREHEHLDDHILRKKPGRTQGDPIPGMEITVEQGFGQTKTNNLKNRVGRKVSIGNFATISSDKKRRIPADKNQIKKSNH